MHDDVIPPSSPINMEKLNLITWVNHLDSQLVMGINSVRWVLLKISVVARADLQIEI